MLTLERLDAAHVDWGALDSLADRVVFQTRPWLSFIAASQNSDLVVAAVRDGPAIVGYFTGLVTRRYGLRILGSPLPGWSTDYLGFNLAEGVSRQAALAAVVPFAFRTLGCCHVEVRDRLVSPGDVDELGMTWRAATTHLVDLRPDEDEIFARMSSACRRAIRKAAKSGVVVEEASDPEFADDYYDQLRDVFAKQALVPTYGIDRVRALIEQLGPTGSLLLLRARDADGRCIATVILPWFNDVMYFWGGASYREHQILRPNEALIWHAIRYAKARGLTQLDMAGGGSYKSKYGTVETVIPWARVSRSPVIAHLRTAARDAFALRQRASARMAALRGSPEFQRHNAPE
jgi:CelD/BcsL family acetyltransferase involved in cellulose biosynthesis